MYEPMGSSSYSYVEEPIYEYDTMAEPMYDSYYDSYDTYSSPIYEYEWESPVYTYETYEEIPADDYYYEDDYYGDDYLTPLDE